MRYEQWQMTATWTSGFHNDPGTGRIRSTLWFTAFDSDLEPGPQPRASVMLISNVGFVAGHWQEYQREIPLEVVRPGLEMLKRLGLPDGRLEGGGVSDGSETWDQFTLLLTFDDGRQLRQCVLGGYHWRQTLPQSIRQFLGQLIASLAEPGNPARDLELLQDQLTRD